MSATPNMPRRRKTRPVTNRTAVEALPASRGFFGEHDLGVVGTCLVLLLLGFVLHGRLARPILTHFDHQGLSFAHPISWLPTQTQGKTPDSVPAQLWFQAIDDPTTRLEIRIEPRPAFTGALAPLLDLARGQTYGDLARKLDSDTTRIANRPWLRTHYVYAYTQGTQGTPALSNAVELAAVHGDRLYVITLHGTPEALTELEPVLTEQLTLR